MFSRNYLQIKEGNSVWFHEIFFKKRRGNSLMYSRNFYWRKKKKCVYGTEILTFTKFLYKKKKNRNNQSMISRIFSTTEKICKSGICRTKNKKLKSSN